MAVKTQNRGGGVIFILDDADDFDKLFDVPPDTHDMINKWSHSSRVRARNVQQVLSVVDFKSNVKQWIKDTGLHCGTFGYDMSWTWHVIEMNDYHGPPFAVQCVIMFKDAKYASLFRLAWL